MKDSEQFRIGSNSPEIAHCSPITIYSAPHISRESDVARRVAKPIILCIMLVLFGGGMAWGGGFSSDVLLLKLGMDDHHDARPVDVLNASCKRNWSQSLYKTPWATGIES